jgi:hypothetical protein
LDMEIPKEKEEIVKAGEETTNEIYKYFYK